jgi:sulfur carrier protein ThiS
MRVEVSVVPRGDKEDREVPEGARAVDLVKELGLPTAACLVLRRGNPIPIDEPLVDGDELEVIYVASGG